MLKIKRYYLSIFLLILSVSASSQVTIDQKVDTMQILIGEQTKLTLSVTLDGRSHKVSFPGFSERQCITPGVEVLETGRTDSVDLDNNMVRYSKSYTLTSFDEKLYCIPSQSITVDGKSYKTKALALKVMTVPVDTVHADKFFPPKDVQDNPFSWAEWRAVFGLSVLFVLILLSAVYLVYVFKTNRPVVKPMRLVKKLSAHQKAINDIEKLKEERVALSDDQKTYYTRLTEILRQYIAERFKFDAMEMTSSEIIDRLRKEDSVAVDEMVSLFRTADLVKFAKYSVLVNENDRNLVNAISFVNDTKIADEKPERIVLQESVEENKVRSRRNILKASIAVLFVAAVLTFITVLYKVYLIF